MKFTEQFGKRVSFTTTQLEKLSKERENQFRLMMFMGAKEMVLNGVKLKVRK